MPARTLLVFVCVLTFGVVCIGDAVTRGSCDNEDDALRTKEQLDRDAARAPKRKDAAEAKSWLAGKKDRAIFGASREESVKTVDGLYAAGAVKVTLAAVNEYADGFGATLVVVELPAHAAARARVVKVWNKFVDGNSIGTPAKDVQQKCIVDDLDG